MYIYKKIRFEMSHQHRFLLSKALTTVVEKYRNYINFLLIFSRGIFLILIDCFILKCFNFDSIYCNNKNCLAYSRKTSMEKQLNSKMSSRGTESRFKFENVILKNTSVQLATKWSFPAGEKHSPSSTSVQL